MSGPFKANPGDIHALAEFLNTASEASRATGVWFCAFGPTEVEIPGGSTIRVAIDGEGDLRGYVIDDRTGD